MWSKCENIARSSVPSDGTMLNLSEFLSKKKSIKEMTDLQTVVEVDRE